MGMFRCPHRFEAALLKCPGKLDRRGGGIAEEPFGRVVDRADCTTPVDHHNGIDRGIDDGTIQGVGETPAILTLQA